MRDFVHAHLGLMTTMVGGLSTILGFIFKDSIMQFLQEWFLERRMKIQMAAMQKPAVPPPSGNGNGTTAVLDKMAFQIIELLRGELAQQKEFTQTQVTLLRELTASINTILERTEAHSKALDRIEGGLQVAFSVKRPV